MLLTMALSVLTRCVHQPAQLLRDPTARDWLTWRYESTTCFEQTKLQGKSSQIAGEAGVDKGLNTKTLADA